MKLQTDTDYIHSLIAEGEHQHQDFKFEISDARKIAKTLSAFANTEGGRLLIGVKDNGRIAGIRSEEEKYMIEAAADLYCTPKIDYDMQTYLVEGRQILIVEVEESRQKPVYAKDESGRDLAYLRVKDENILATPVHLRVWEQSGSPAGELTEYDLATIREFTDVKAQVERLLDEFRFRDAQKEAMNLARIGNKYLADSEPWKVIKTDPERVKTILNIAIQLVANLAVAFEPFLPFSSSRLREMLAVGPIDWDRLGSTDLIEAGHKLGTPALLFEKIEDDVIDFQVNKLKEAERRNAEANYRANPVKVDISFDDFEKLDIRVGTVLECERVPKADKLLRFLIADGLDNRTIVSGIAQHYKPEELVGKQVCFIANLPPRKLRGIESQGMILSAENFDGSLSVVTTLSEVKPGSEVK